MSYNAVRLGFDKLSSAICFFDAQGWPVLCNRQMYHLSQILLGGDLQDLAEMEQVLSSPPEMVTPLPGMKDACCFPDGSVWQFEKTNIVDRYGSSYVQLVASDVTELYHALIQLSEDNHRLSEDAKRIQRLVSNAKAAAREQELLVAKSAMHDKFAACSTITRQYLDGMTNLDASVVVREWEKSLSFREEHSAILQESIFAEAGRCGVKIRFFGQWPEGSAAELLYAAMQVCLNNAVRHAKASELLVSVTENQYDYLVQIKNNGIAPDEEIAEGGGLSNLRRRLEVAGGFMTIKSLPEFALIIDIPGNKEAWQ